MATIKTSVEFILNRIHGYHAQNRRMNCVYDLDSTLFDVSSRTQKILHEFVAQLNDENMKKIIASVKVKSSDWGLKEAFISSGAGELADTTIHNDLRDFWLSRFFSNEYLHYDVPTPGAVAFSHRLSQFCDSTFYLTGRDELRMGKGTREVLKKWGFADGEITLKPNKELDDSHFKLDWVEKLVAKARPQNEKILFFENEPVNINLIGSRFPEIDIIFLDTTHSRRQEIAVPVLQISHFSDLDLVLDIES